MLGTAAAAASAGCRGRWHRTKSTQEAEKRKHRKHRSKNQTSFLILADQFRWDFIGATVLTNSTKYTQSRCHGRAWHFVHPCGHQPAGMFTLASVMLNRPLCDRGPAFGTNAIAHPIRPLPTLAGELRKAGYTAKFVGQVASLLPPTAELGGGPRILKPEYRGGFLRCCGKAPTSFGVYDPPLSRARSTMAMAKEISFKG